MTIGSQVLSARLMTLLLLVLMAVPSVGAGPDTDRPPQALLGMLQCFDDVGFPVVGNVQVDDGENIDMVRQALVDCGCILEEQFHTIPVVPVRFTDRRQLDYATWIPHVEWVRAEQEVPLAMDISIPSVLAEPSVEYSPNTAHELGYRGQNITVAVIDGGVDNEHPTFNGAFLGGADFSLPDSPLNPRDGSIDPDDVDGHGTGCASVVVGRGVNGSHVGMAPEAGLLDLQIRKGGPTLENPIARAVEWCVEHRDTDWGNGYRGVDVISLSAALGGQGDVAHQAIKVATENGIYVVSAATNSGTSQQDDPSRANFWDDYAITTGGTDDKDTIDRSDDTHWEASTWGPREDDGDDNPYDEMRPDVSAPAYQVEVADFSRTSDMEGAQGWIPRDGTSYATPHVSGAVALMLEANPDIRPSLESYPARKILHRTAEARGDPYDTRLSDKYNEYFGYGILDTYEAVLAAEDYQETNVPPRLIEFTATPEEVTAGGTVAVSAFAVDDDEEPVSYQLSADDGTVSGSGRQWQWTAPDIEGSCTLTMTVTDRAGEQDSETIEVSVSAPDAAGNSPPIISSFTSSVDRLRPAGRCTLDVTVSDLDGDDLSYTYDADDGRIEGSGGSVTFVAPDYEGRVEIRVVVSDGRGGSDSSDLYMMVYEGTALAPPRLLEVSLSHGTMQAGDMETSVILTAKVERTDADIHRVTADLTDLGVGSEQVMTDDGVFPDSAADDMVYTLVVLGTGELAAGVYDISVMAVDSEGGMSTEGKVRLTVEEEIESDAEMYDPPEHGPFGLSLPIILIVVIVAVAVGVTLIVARR